MEGTKATKKEQERATERKAKEGKEHYQRKEITPNKQKKNLFRSLACLLSFSSVRCAVFAFLSFSLFCLLERSSPLPLLSLPIPEGKEAALFCKATNGRGGKEAAPRWL
jgi:hypothetical protein